MKTLQDLKNLLPILLTEFTKQDARNRCHRYDEYNTDTLFYDEDGWYIEIVYDVDCDCRYESATRDCPSSSWIEGFSAEIVDWTIANCDPDTDEEVNITECAEVDELLEEIEKIINE